jgi:hypothetical protein
MSLVANPILQEDAALWTPELLPLKLQKEYEQELFAKMAVFWVVAPCSLVNWYKSTRRYNPEDSHLHSHRRENLKSYQEVFVFVSVL